MNLQRINEILKDAVRGNVPKGLKILKSETTPDFYDEGQGIDREKVILYTIEDEEDLVLEVKSATDSYGDNESVISVQFVRAYEVNTVSLS